MYKVDFDSFFIQLQCPFLYHASVETYLTNFLGPKGDRREAIMMGKACRGKPGSHGGKVILVSHA